MNHAFDGHAVTDGWAYCENCWRQKQYTEFHRSTRTPRGVYVWCRTCVEDAAENKRLLPEPLYNSDQILEPNPILSGSVKHQAAQEAA